MNTEFKQNFFTSKDICACICTRLDNFDYLYETLESILKQTIQVNKILIVYSGRSKSELALRKQKFKNEYISKIDTRYSEKIKFLFYQKYGLGKARNFASGKIKEKITIFGDDDDIWDKFKVEATISIFNKNNFPILVRHSFNYLKNKKITKCRKIYNFNIGLTLGSIANYFGGGSTLSGQTKIFNVIRFNEKLPFCEDWDFWMRAKLADIKIKTINTPLVTYRIHANRMTQSFFKNFKWEVTVRLNLFTKGLKILFFILIGFFISSLKLISRIVQKLINK